MIQRSINKSQYFTKLEKINIIISQNIFDLSDDYLDKNKFHEHSNIFIDLNLSKTKFILLIHNLEKYYNIDISEYNDISTIGQLSSYINSKLFNNELIEIKSKNYIC